MGSFIADRRLYLTADRDRVVEEGDASAAILFATPGTVVADEDVARYGLGAPAPEPVAEEPEADSPPPVEKSGATARKRGGS